jgi:hypothetical protein
MAHADDLSASDGRGCGYCADDQNMFFGHVQQVSSSEQRGTLLVRCPHCGWHYEITPRGDARSHHLSEEVARERFTF